jgi:hypothetical protein
MSPNQLMAELVALADDIAKGHREIDADRARLRTREEALMADQKRFHDLLAQGTDGANALVFNGRAWWVSGGTLCHIRLWDSPSAREGAGR